MIDPITTWTQLSPTGQTQQVISSFGSGPFGAGSFDVDQTLVGIFVATSWTPIFENDGGFVPYSATGYRTVIGGYGHGTYGHGIYGIGAGRKVVRNADLSTAWSQTATK